MPRYYEVTKNFKDKIENLIDQSDNRYQWVLDCEIIMKDIKKVDFNFENFDFSKGGFGGKLSGYQKDGDFEFWGCAAGGDWEQPVFFIIYWDGKDFRGYVPKEGNPWNRTTKQAYGNSNEDDLKDMIKQGLLPKNAEEGDEDGVNLDFEKEKILQDIRARIIKKNE